MIQVLALREFFSQKQKRNIKSEVWFDRGIRAPSVEDILLRPKEILGPKVEGSERFNVYFTVAECLEEPGRKLLVQHHIPFDVDKLDLPNEIVQTADLMPVIAVVCEALGVKYTETGVVFSGNGLQFFIRTNKPITHEGYFDEARSHYKALCDKITAALAREKIQGQADPSVWSPARLMRMPDTENIKPNKPKRMARVIQPVIVETTFTLESASGVPKVAPGEALNARVLADLITPDVKAILDPVNGCKFISWVTTNPESVSEPEWYAALSVVGRFPEGRKFAHKMSEGHKGYSFEETDTKITQALEASGPRTCKSIEAISDRCKTCVHFNTDIVSPIRIEGPDHIKTEKSGFYEIIYDKNGNVRQGKPAYGDLWKFFCKKHKYISIRNTQILYVFNGKFWDEMGKDDVLKFAHEHFDPKPTANIREEFYKWVKVHYLHDMDWFTESVEGYLNFSNGIYDVANGTLLPHSPDFGFRHVLPCAYDPSAKAPLFYKFLDDVTVQRKELELVLQEFMGYVFGNMACRHEKIMVWLGTGSNGKSTFVKLIRALCGDDAHAGLSVKDMQNDQNRYLLEGKLVNIAEENSKDAFRDTELLKNFASGGMIRVKKLYSQPYEYENRTKLIMLANELPHNMDQSHGFYRKLIIVPFDARFEAAQKDKGIAKKLLAELPGIFNFAMEGYRRLTEQDDFTESTVVSKQIQNYQDTTDSVKAWFMEDVELSKNDDDAQSTAEIYDSYKDYCMQTGVKYPEHMAIFGKRFKSLMESAGKKYERRLLGSRGERHWKIMGVKLRTFNS